MEVAGSCVTVDALGNAYVGGVFEGAAVLSGSNVLSNGEWDYFVSKYDSRGSLVWIVTGGGSGGDELYDIAVDVYGGVYVTGRLFDPTNQRYQRTLKFDNNGRFLWSLDTGGDGIAVDREGDLIITGTEVGELPYGRFMAKYNNAGNMLWAFTNAAYPFSIGRKVSTDANGNIFLVGKHGGDLNSDATATNYAPTTFIAKYNPAGQLLWSRDATTRYSEYLRVTLAVDSSGNSYMTTGFEGSLRLGFVEFVASNRVDTLVATFTPDGELRWARQIRGQSYVYPEGVAVDGTGRVTIVGAFSGADFGSVALRAAFGYGDLFVARFDSTGNFLGVRQVAGALYAIPWGVAVTSNGEALITGQLGEHYCFSPQPFVSFGPHPIGSFGLYDFFLARIGR